MGLSDIFKSNKELEKEKRRAKREKERSVERCISNFSDKVKHIEKERAKIWTKAVELTKNGQKTEAARLLQTYKAQGVMISGYEKKRIFAQNQLDMISGAADMAEVAETIKNLGETTNVDPIELTSNIDDIEMVSADVKDMDAAMNKAFEKDQERLIEYAENDSEIGIDDDLMSALESEAAASVLGPNVINTPSASTNKGDDINAGRDKLKELLGEK